MHALDPVKRRSGVGELALTVIELALTASDPAKIEAKYGKTAFDEHVK